MLERIAEVQGIGLLHQANGKPYTCQKATLIYADNGRGKSTLATLLRSVSTGDASLIADRKTVDGALPPKAVLHFNSGHKVSFDAGAWSEQRPEVLVFDADFIEHNVHSGGSVSTGHRKNLLEFALGEAAVAARSAVEKATNDAKVETGKVQALAAQLSGHHAGMTLQQFEKLPKVPDADVQVGVLQKRIVAAGNVAAIVAKPLPVTAVEPTFDLASIFADLGTSLKDVHADAEKTVKQHAEKLGSKAAEGWLSQGHQFDDGKTCPYCGQGTVGNDLIQAYQTHFNVAYAALKAKVASLHGAVHTATASTIVGVFAQAVAVAAAHANAWAEYVKTEPIVFDAEAAQAALADLQALLLNLCDKKQAAPSESAGSVEDLELAKSLWDKVLTCMHTANDAINAANALISTYKGQLATENAQQLQQQVQHLQACKRRHDSIVVGLFSQLATARFAADAAEKIKKGARDNLDTLMTATLAKYEKAINSLLKNFGASFSIKGMGANFRGAAPRTEYGLQLRGKDVALDGGSPTFATALSEGDKRTLAFAFFIASAMADPKLGTRTIVIDDPMCSLDLNRKHHTRAVLKRLHSKAEQLVVLAHDPYFIRDLRDSLRKDDSAAAIALFQLGLAPGDYTNFESLDVDKVCESVYFQHHRVLNEFAAGNGGDPKAVAKAIRPMLEGYLHRRFPGLVPKSLMFGQVLALIRDAVPPSPLCHAKNMVDELNEINEYAGQFHHDANPSADAVAVIASELKIYVDRALSAVHKGA
ncbi:MAG: AAA family ATPase [Burkholderiaceae bacterium]